MGFTILNINASRIGKKEKLIDVLTLINSYSPSVVCIQEINTMTVYRYFQEYFQVIVNREDDKNDDIGIVTLMNKKCKIA